MIDPTVKQKLILAPIVDSPRECIKVLVRPNGSEYYLRKARAHEHTDELWSEAGKLGFPRGYYMAWGGGRTMPGMGAATSSLLGSLHGTQSR